MEKLLIFLVFFALLVEFFKRISLKYIFFAEIQCNSSVVICACNKFCHDLLLFHYGVKYETLREE